MMAESRDLDLPIALRRTPRHCVSSAAARLTEPKVAAPAPSSIIAKTPSKPRPKKRVRFSDPGPELSHYDATSSLCSTGLTPMIKRSSLGEPSPKRRRVPAAALRRASTTDLSDDESTNDVLSLSQVYDTRLRRRIKRSVLGEEMDMSIKSKKKNTGSRTRKGNIATAAEVEAEVQRLRAELAGRDAEIERLQNETMVHDTERIMELEQQIEALRTELAQRQLPVTGTNNEIEEGDSDNDGDQPSRSFYDWTLAARDPFSDSYLDESDDFRDVTMEDVACSTPSRRKSANPASSKSASASFPTPPCTSPTMPATPCSVRRAITPVTPPSHVGIQASLPDPEKEALEAELGSLRLELTKLTNTLESHAALQDRLAEKLSGAASVSPTQDGESSQPELEEHVNLVLQKLSDRTAALLELSSSLSALGFAGSDASEMIASIASGFRAARLELEYLTPGEITLPLSSHGAEVLDLVLTRLRDMARKGRKDDDAIDEYHALELSLRQQLSARVDAMEGMRHEQKKNATVLRERDDRIAELEFGLDRLKGAAEGYRRDIVELESLVQRLEGNEKATEAKLQADLQSTQAQLSERTAVIADLEAKLASTLTQADELETKLKDLQRRKDAETKVRNKSHGAALALRDARVLELRREIYGINESVRNAHETIRKLRVENGKLERKVDMAEEEKRIAKETVDTMKAELEKVTAAAAAAAPRRRKTRSSSSRDNGPATPDPEPGSFLSGDLARSGAGKGGKKRRYDSGLGFLDEEEDEVELLS